MFHGGYFGFHRIQVGPAAKGDRHSLKEVVLLCRRSSSFDGGRNPLKEVVDELVVLFVHFYPTVYGNWGF